MSNNVAIQVCIGLVFIFLLYSLMATILQEILARWLGLRARMLMKAVRRMLEDGDPKSRLTILDFCADQLESIANFFRPLKKDSFVRAFYEYPLIRYLGENNWTSKPSYLNASQFSDTIIHLLRGKGFGHHVNQMALIHDNLASNRIAGFRINTHTLSYLRELWADSNNDIQVFRMELEGWFNGTMARATGWYKRQVQFLLFIIGLVLAVNFNVDCITIGRILSRSETARTQMIDLVNHRYQNYGNLVANLDKQGKDTLASKVRQLDSAMGSSYKEVQDDANVATNILGLGDRKEMEKKRDAKGNLIQPDGPALYAGWLLTALAISLGAPFWFDLLNKFMTLRAAGAKPGTGGSKKGSADNSKNRVG